MRDCIFLLADTNMKAAFEGFFTRDGFYRSLRCGEFDFDPRRDIAVAAGDNDPGLYTRGHELLRPYQSTHRHALIVLDAAWEGSPGAEQITEQITRQVLPTGWAEGAFKVIVIDPELENWIWQRNEHVARGLGYGTCTELLEEPDVIEAWPEQQSKPDAPKELMEALLEKRRIPRSSAIYKQITGHVSVNRCRDDAFRLMVKTLRAWFPPKGQT